jgi:hypothetical protein
MAFQNCLTKSKPSGPEIATAQRRTRSNPNLTAARQSLLCTTPANISRPALYSRAVRMTPSKKSRFVRNTIGTAFTARSRSDLNAVVAQLS